jgi:hypothetical protein
MFLTIWCPRSGSRSPSSIADTQQPSWPKLGDAALFRVGRLRAVDAGGTSRDLSDKQHVRWIIIFTASAGPSLVAWGFRTRNRMGRSPSSLPSSGLVRSEYATARWRIGTGPISAWDGVRSDDRALHRQQPGPQAGCNDRNGNQTVVGTADSLWPSLREVPNHQS